MITRTLTPAGWLVTETENENSAGTNSKSGMTASEIELSRKLLHAQSEILLVREKVEKIETVVEAGLIAHGASSR